MLSNSVLSIVLLILVVKMISCEWFDENRKRELKVWEQLVGSIWLVVTLFIIIKLTKDMLVSMSS